MITRPAAAPGLLLRKHKHPSTWNIMIDKESRDSNDDDDQPSYAIERRLVIKEIYFHDS